VNGRSCKASETPIDEYFEGGGGGGCTGRERRESGRDSNKVAGEAVTLRDGKREGEQGGGYGLGGLGTEIGRGEGWRKGGRE
jgi:hypothetical protein